MKIKALKFRCNNYKDLASLSFFTDLKLLYLKLNMYILKDIESVIREIILPYNLEHLYLAHDYDGDTSVSKMEEYIKRICDNIKVPFGCKVKIIIFSSKEMIIYDMEDELYCNNKLNYHDDSTDIKNIFLNELCSYFIDDDDFVDEHLTLSQLLKYEQSSLRNIFFNEIYSYFIDDDDFVDEHLTLSQLLKIQKLNEREE